MPSCPRRRRQLTLRRGPAPASRGVSHFRARLARAGSWRRVGGTSRCSLARACSLSWGRSSRSPRACRRGARPSRSASRAPPLFEATTRGGPPDHHAPVLRVPPPSRGAQVPRVQPEPPRDRGAVPDGGRDVVDLRLGRPRAPRPAPPRVSRGRRGGPPDAPPQRVPGTPHALRANHRLRARAPRRLRRDRRRVLGRAIRLRGRHGRRAARRALARASPNAASRVVRRPRRLRVRRRRGRRLPPCSAAAPRSARPARRSGATAARRASCGR